MFTEDKYLEWLELIAELDYLMAEIANMINPFEAFYIDAKNTK